jgi:hypothetical protein
MKTQSIDTHAEAERALVILTRKESLSKKFSHILSFSQTIIQLSKRAISRANRKLDADQKKLLFIKFHYGKGLADRVEKYIGKGHNERT